MELGASVNLDVCILPENFRTVIDIIDLTRILGILLDNAIEETARIPNGIIEIGTMKLPVPILSKILLLHKYS